MFGVQNVPIRPSGDESKPCQRNEIQQPQTLRGHVGQLKLLMLHCQHLSGMELTSLGSKSNEKQKTATTPQQVIMNEVLGSTPSAPGNGRKISRLRQRGERKHRSIQNHSARNHCCDEPLCSLIGTVVLVVPL